jgi:hypothetical protein
MVLDSIQGLNLEHRVQWLDPVDRVRWIDPLHRLRRLHPVDRVRRIAGLHRVGKLVRQHRRKPVGTVHPGQSGVAVERLSISRKAATVTAVPGTTAASGPALR